MSEPRHCPHCDVEIPANSPMDLCPRCLLKAGTDSQSVSVELGPTNLIPSTSGFVPPTPEELSKWFPQLEILELLGKGGMGAVYKARQPGLDRIVAIKILPPEISHDPAFAERFQREARALARLSHPHIVAVYDFGETGSGIRENSEGVSEFSRIPLRDGLCYIVMEFVDGANLRQAIRAGKLTSTEALAIVPQICEALQFAHDEGIVHRDIKPENILIDKRGRVKIADFGLAKLLGTDATDHSLTGTHQVMGTLRYMAPEQMQGSREVDHRADIYSLGVVFYELLTGELPMGKFAPPSKRVQVDVRLDEVVLRALEQDPEQRYQHASEVQTDVETISRESQSPNLAAQRLAHRDGRTTLAEPKSLPFEIEKRVHWGLFGELHGKLRLGKNELIVEFEVRSLFQAFRSGLKEVRIPFDDIESVNWDGWELTLHTKTMKALTEIPNSSQGQIAFDLWSVEDFVEPGGGLKPVEHFLACLPSRLAGKFASAAPPPTEARVPLEPFREVARFDMTPNPSYAKRVGIPMAILFALFSMVTIAAHSVYGQKDNYQERPLVLILSNGAILLWVLVIILHITFFARRRASMQATPTRFDDSGRAIPSDVTFPRWLLLTPRDFLRTSVLEIVTAVAVALAFVIAAVKGIYELAQSPSPLDVVAMPVTAVAAMAAGVLLIVHQFRRPSGSRAALPELFIAILAACAGSLPWTAVFSPIAGWNFWQGAVFAALNFVLGLFLLVNSNARPRSRAIATLVVGLISFALVMQFNIGPVGVIGGSEFLTTITRKPGLPGMFIAAALSLMAMIAGSLQLRAATSETSSSPLPDTGTPLTQIRFTASDACDVARHAIFHFSSLGYQLIEQHPDACVFHRGHKWGGLWETEIRKLHTILSVRTTPATSGVIWVSCAWSVRTLGAWISRNDIQQLETEGRGLEALLNQGVLNRSETLPDSEAASTAISPQPRFSRFAIAGAVWALFGLLAVIPTLFFIGLNRVWNGTALPTDIIYEAPPVEFTIFMGALLAIGAGAPIGTTIYGAISIGHIKRSGGRITGLPLAVVDVLFFPLLAVFAGIAVPVSLTLHALLPLQMIAVAVPSAMIASVVCLTIGFAVWSKVIPDSALAAITLREQLRFAGIALLIAGIMDAVSGLVWIGHNISVLVELLKQSAPIGWQVASTCLSLGSLWIAYYVVGVALHLMTLEDDGDFTFCLLTAAIAPPGCLIGLPVAIYAMVQLSKPEVKALIPAKQLEVAAASTSIQPQTIPSQWEVAVRTWWFARSNVTRKVLWVALNGIFVVCFFAFLSFEGVADSDRNTHFKIGWLDPWFVYESNQGNGERSVSGIFWAWSWLFGIGSYGSGWLLFKLKRKPDTFPPLTNVEDRVSSTSS